MGKKIYLTPDQIDNVSCEKECQETSINWLREDKLAIICTSDNTFITKMRRTMERGTGEIKCYTYEDNIDKSTGKYFSLFFECPKSLVAIRAKSKDKKEHSIEEKFNMIKRLHPEKYQDYTLEQYIEEYGEKVEEGLCFNRPDLEYIDEEDF